MIISTAKAKTPIGIISVTATEIGVISVLFPNHQRPNELTNAQLKEGYSIDSTAQDIAAKAAKEIESYWNGYVLTFDSPIDTSRLSPFTRDIYGTLKKIPLGQTVTYQQLADLAKHPGKARAVGGAMGRNPFPIIVPCHRVVSSSGKLGGWSGPKGLKENLLLMEKQIAR